MIIGKYRLGRVIGTGTYSTVKQGYNMFSKETVAVKIINKKSYLEPISSPAIQDLSQINKNATNTTPKNRAQPNGNDRWLDREISVLKKLSCHPGVVKFIEFLEDKTSYYLVMEFLGGGELYDFIISHHCVEEKLAKKFFKQIVSTLNYVHSVGIAHRDLKPENILLTDSNRVKLIDFGLCSDDANKMCTNLCGSELYLAPETLKNIPYDGRLADIWALGVILYALVVGQIPWDYQNPEKMHLQIKNAEFSLPNNLSKPCCDLIKAILNPNPLKRITIERILNHEWLKSVDDIYQMKSAISKQPSITKDLGKFDLNSRMSPYGSLKRKQCLNEKTKANDKLKNSDKTKLSEKSKHIDKLTNKSPDKSTNKSPDKSTNKSPDKSTNKSPDKSTHSEKNSTSRKNNENRTNKNENNEIRKSKAPSSLENGRLVMVRRKSEIQKTKRPRKVSAISFQDKLDMSDYFHEDSDDMINNEEIHVKRGSIVSQTITQQDPKVVAAQFADFLKKKGIVYSCQSSLLFNIRFLGMSIDAEVCKLLGFRKMYVISFKRIKGESYEYAKFVSSLLDDLKKVNIFC
ncbi:CAMK family protein kinase [Tritrichomonas foetus]|uniref:non-specific serine/threonine protein kinase n=1 Tax=Tritrichomonas foetus TaxID=1144522 RepID=A0A1J4J6L5_9EUKA|nr:CAMK family protein kinase [Tritrichomonas foetus]|eukprot:OHS92820.1 CAMK family protein kinase [Tritrichomonas foetus]